MDLIGTVDDNAELSEYELSDDDLELDPNLQFDDLETDKPQLTNIINFVTGSLKESSLDRAIKEVRARRKVPAESAVAVQSVFDENSDIIREKFATSGGRSGADEAEADRPVEGEQTIDYSEVVENYKQESSFDQMHLSRPLLRALTAMKFAKPTPIQAATVPVALLGKDICACAATGTGKTAAFMLPILERLLHSRLRTQHHTRVLVLVPTRELAVQVYNVSRQLAQFTDVAIGMATGGLDLAKQEAILRRGPEIVIATPGRLIDHLHNSPSFSLDNIEILVLDEADRMLDEYFEEQMREVIRLCAPTRQTMLFSATMTEKVRDLAAVSLQRPVRIFLSRSSDTAVGLQQEFIRIRPQREDDRLAILAALLLRTFTERVIVFLPTKVLAHRLHVTLGLLGLTVAELHGNMTQDQRLSALHRFRNADCSVLLASDLASRGLDIENVQTIINYTMPANLQRYIHRVGRTARFNCEGRSVTLVGEKDRKLLKEILRSAPRKDAIKQRVVPADVIAHFNELITSIEPEVEEVLRMEKEEKLLGETERTVLKAERLLNKTGKEQSAAGGVPNAATTVGHERKRTWFQSKAERAVEQKRLKEGRFFENGPASKKGKSFDNERSRKKDKAKQRQKEEQEKEQRKIIAGAKRAKKELNPRRLRACGEDVHASAGQRHAKRRRKATRASSLFTQ